MTDKIRPHITNNEAHCRCGCGGRFSDATLDWGNEYIERCGFSLPISTSKRCKGYNARIGGVKDSPHRLVGEEFGAFDLANANPTRRMKMIEVAIDMKREGKINQIECCDRHIHIARVPQGHRLEGLFNWGKSK